MTGCRTHFRVLIHYGSSLDETIWHKGQMHKSASHGRHQSMADERKNQEMNLE